jgi:hypothetical protein
MRRDMRRDMRREPTYYKRALAHIHTIEGASIIIV